MFVGLYGKGGDYKTALQFGRAAARLIPYCLTEAAISPILQGRKVPNSFMPAKVSILDNLYMPIGTCFSELEIRQWFVEAGFQESNVVRTKTTIYDHRKGINRLIHGEGYLQFRGEKSN